ncbi:MAG TPA: diguanylate cyclase, partial [Pseudomonas sp.]|nr:diguanylate cyclase [Pseudomonas sp.]
MQQIPNHQLVAEWLRLLDGYPAEAAAALQAVSAEKSQELAEHFYSQMLADPHSASFLSHEQVKTRLGQSMQKWIVTVCSSTAHSDLDAVVDLQRKVGDIHARIEIPVSLVLRGSRLLKGRLRQLLEQRELDEPVRRKAA